MGEGEGAAGRKRGRDRGRSRREEWNGRKIETDRERVASNERGGRH